MGFSQVIIEKVVNKPRKRHRCYICKEWIEGSHLTRTYIGGDYDYPCRIRLHKECVDSLCGVCKESQHCYYDMAECYYEREKERQKRHIEDIVDSICEIMCECGEEPAGRGCGYGVNEKGYEKIKLIIEKLIEDKK